MAKTILITGASSGFGRLTAETLARAGHKVFAGFRSTSGTRREVGEELKAEKIELVQLDVTDQASVDSAVKQLLERAGGALDVVVNNAGFASAGLSESFTPEQIRDMFEVNVFGVQRVIRATLPTLRAKKAGLIINIGSILGRVTFPFFGLYGASKHALEAMTDSYRYELSQLGIDFVLVQPSAYPTNMYAAAQAPADPTRAEGYGAIAQVPGQILAKFGSIFQGNDAPKPQDVASAIEKLVATAPGSRPDRVVVGLPFCSDSVNAAAAPIQERLIEELGLGSLAKLKTS